MYARSPPPNDGRYMLGHCFPGGGTTCKQATSLHVSKAPASICSHRRGQVQQGPCSAPTSSSSGGTSSPLHIMTMSASVRYDAMRCDVTPDAEAGHKRNKNVGEDSSNLHCHMPHGMGGGHDWSLLSPRDHHFHRQRGAVMEGSRNDLNGMFQSTVCTAQYVILHLHGGREWMYLTVRSNTAAQHTVPDIQ